MIIAELISHGVRELVLAPGSRSAPLAYEAYEADRIGLLRLHVRIDERTAGFLALGLAKGSGAPVAVLTTSGTAAANLHPAVLEAWHDHQPLIMITASRPRSLINTGANQTTDQDQLFGRHVRAFAALTDQVSDPRDLALRDRPADRGGHRSAQPARPARCSSTSSSASRWCRPGSTGRRPGRISPSPGPDPARRSSCPPGRRR